MTLKRDHQTGLLLVIFASVFFGDPIYDGVFIVRVFDIIVFLLVFVSMAKMSRGLRFGHVKNKFSLYLAAYICLIFLSMLWGAQTQSVVKEMIQFLELLVFFVVFVDLYIDYDVDRMTRWFYVVVVATTIIFTAGNFLRGRLIGYKESTNRIVPGIATSMAYGFLLFTENSKQRFNRLMAFLFLALLTLITLERKSWIALVASVAMQYIFYYMYVRHLSLGKVLLRILRFSLIMVLLFVILFSVSSLLSPRVTRYLKTVVELVDLFRAGGAGRFLGSNVERYELLTKGLTIWKGNPVIGVGTENFRTEYDKIRTFRVSHGAHNEFLRMLVELGLVGFAIFTLMVFSAISPLREANRVLNKDGPASRGVSTILIIGLWAYGVMINLFRASSLLNYVLFLLPAVFSILHHHHRRLEASHAS